MIAILLSTYNGSKYLREQLNSIIDQTITDWVLYIRDDGSTDETMSIIKEYVSLYTNVSYIGDSDNLGSARSFMKLLESVDADYYMFCDQDDVWLPTKIEISLMEMEKQEVLHPHNIPILISTNLVIVDKNLNIISNSFWEYSKFDVNLILQQYLCITNFITGCTTFFNKRAKEVSIQSSYENIIMHDYWIGLCVYANGGVIMPIDTPTIYYRQHENNVLGAGKESERPSLIKKIISIKKNYAYNKTLYCMVNSQIRISYFNFWRKKVDYLFYKRFKKTE